MTVEAGAVLGRKYRLERELSRGGMGVLWAAAHVVTKRAVAIKLLRTGSSDPAARARLVREARASCAVDHPAVVPVLDVIEVEGAPALVMDLLVGESLRARLDREGKLSVQDTCALLAPVAEALAAAHAVGIVHRDVKPENVFLQAGTDGKGERVRVLDFGVAKLVATEGATSNLTETGAMLGTPYYMAPEQAFGERDVGPAADAWALGIVIHECIVGRRPTEAENLGQVIKRITQEPIPPLEGVPSDIAALVGRLLDREPKTRERDMKKVAAALAECAGVLRFSGDEGPWIRPRSIGLVIAAVVFMGTLGAWFGARRTDMERGGPLAAPVGATHEPPRQPMPHAEPAPIPIVSASAAPAASTAAKEPSAPRPSAKPAPSASAPAVPTTAPGRVIVEPPF